MRLRDILIAVFMFSLVMTSLGYFYVDTFNNYKDVTNYSIREGYLNESYVQFNETQSLAQEITDQIYNSTLSGSSSSELTIRSGYSAAKLYLENSQVLARTIIDRLTFQLQIPNYIRDAFIGIIVISVIFTIISGVLQNQW